MPNQNKTQNSTAAKYAQLCNRLLFINRTVFFAVLLGIVLSGASQTVSAQSFPENRELVTRKGVSANSAPTPRSSLVAPNYQTVPKPETSELEGLILKGNALETPSENRPIDWNEALNFWESALRDYPSEALLLKRYYRARIQYDLNYRLADRRYVELVNNMSTELGRETLSDILYKINFS